MKEYIEREAALVAIKNLYPGIPFVKALRQRWHDDNRAYMQCERAVDAIPAADVVEVRHGRWEERIVDDPLDPYGFFKRRWYCSSCGRYQTYGRTAFCPNCGAKMDGGANDGKAD